MAYIFANGHRFWFFFTLWRCFPLLPNPSTVLLLLRAFSPERLEKSRDVRERGSCPHNGGVRTRPISMMTLKNAHGVNFRARRVENSNIYSVRAPSAPRTTFCRLVHAIAPAAVWRSRDDPALKSQKPIDLKNYNRDDDDVVTTETSRTLEIGGGYQKCSSATHSTRAQWAEYQFNRTKQKKRTKL